MQECGWIEQVLGPMVALQVAILNAEDAVKWEGATELYFKSAFGREGDKLTIFNLPKGEMPSMEDIQTGALVPRCPPIYHQPAMQMALH